MAKPTYMIGNLDWETLTRISSFLGGAVPAGATVGVAAPAAPAPPAPVAPAAPPPVAAPAPPPPPAPPAPVVPATPPPVAAPASGVTMEMLIGKMGEIVAIPGKAASVGALMAQYNSKAPGTPGPIGNVDPVQYQNLMTALSAL